jgi:hypothetical protein
VQAYRSCQPPHLMGMAARGGWQACVFNMFADVKLGSDVRWFVADTSRVKQVHIEVAADCDSEELSWRGGEGRRGVVGIYERGTRLVGSGLRIRVALLALWSSSFSLALHTALHNPGCSCIAWIGVVT